jgi:hypothetical protein
MIQTKDDIIRNLEIANSNLIREKEIARYDAETFRTAAGFLWASLNAVLDDYQHKAHITDSVLEQALVALEWTPPQEGETG